MFSKKIAGIGAAVALVGSALVPSMAFAAPDPGTSPVLDQASVTVKKVVTINDDIDTSGDLFAFTVRNVTTDPTVDTDNPGGESGFKNSTGIDLTIPRLAPDATSPSILPTDMTVFGDVNSGPGIYEWIVAENSTIATSETDTVNSKIGAGHTVRFDGVSYRVKAYVGVDPEYVAPGDAAHPYPLKYNGITIVQLTNHKGTAISPVKVDKMEFNNVYEDTPDDPGDDPDDPDDDVYGFTLTKHVVNPSGANEKGPYTIKVTFGWPTNFNGTTWTTNKPEIDVVDSTQGSCTAKEADKETECEVTLAAVTGTDVTAKFSGVPVGATYKVQETAPTQDGFTASYGNATVDGTATVPATGAAVTVTNTYTDITPTGIMLAVLPYVLMIGIPLLAIAGYIALRRKMNL